MVPLLNTLKWSRFTREQQRKVRNCFGMPARENCPSGICGGGGRSGTAGAGGCGGCSILSGRSRDGDAIQIDSDPHQSTVCRRSASLGIRAPSMQIVLIRFIMLRSVRAARLTNFHLIRLSGHAMKLVILSAALAVSLVVPCTTRNRLGLKPRVAARPPSKSCMLLVRDEISLACIRRECTQSAGRAAPVFDASRFGQSNGSDYLPPPA
jgi:hypothetical protein